MSKALKIVISIALAVSLIGCGTVLAMMIVRSQKENNSFVPAVVSCEVLETFENDFKTSIKVKNTGNVDAYLRVCFVTYWVDKDGNVMPEPSEELNFGYDDTKWIKGTGNIYYYKIPVAPSGESESFTDELLKENIQLKNLAVDAENGVYYYQVIEVFAEAIQALPANAVTTSWGVILDDSGKITAVS